MDAVAKQQARELPVQEISLSSSTSDQLAHAREGARKRGLQDWLVVDVDSHHVETVSWSQLVQYIEDPVIRHQAILASQKVEGGTYGLNGEPGLKYQDVGGRIPHQSGLRETVDDKSVHRDVTLSRRAMDSFGIDYQVLFPTPMLTLGMHPQPEMEVYLGRAYNRWLIDHVLSVDDRIKTLAYLPFSIPEEAERTIEEFTGKPGVLGFCVTSTRYKAVHHNDYMRVYSMLQERGLPIAFHAAYHWEDPSLATINLRRSGELGGAADTEYHFHAARAATESARADLWEFFAADARRTRDVLAAHSPRSRAYAVAAAAHLYRLAAAAPLDARAVLREAEGDAGGLLYRRIGTDLHTAVSGPPAAPWPEAARRHLESAATAADLELSLGRLCAPHRLRPHLFGAARRLMDRNLHERRTRADATAGNARP